MTVRKIKLSAPQFIPPDVIRAAERLVETTVIDQKGVFVNGHLLRSEEAPLELGKVARVFIWNGRVLAKKRTFTTKVDTKHK